MFLTDQATASSTLPAPAAAGTPGYFTNGNPASGVAATIVDADWLNMLQLELMNIVTAAGITPSKTTYTQVLAAIKRVNQNTVVLADTGAANAYTATNSVPLTAATWVDGVVQSVKIAHTNTGASTYAPDGLAAIPIYGLGLQPLQGGELLLNGTAILMHLTIAGVNNGNPICVLMECAGGAQQVAPATASAHAAQLKQVVGIAGSAGNLKCVTTAVGTSLQYTADQLLVASALNGLTYMIPSFSANISALDTGALAANSYYAVYAYLKSDGTTGGFFQLEPAGGAPAVYGGANPPANMIASALIGVWPTNASAQFIVASQVSRKISFVPTTLANGSSTVAFTSISAAAIIPKTARFIKGGLSITLSTTGVATTTLYTQSASGANSVVASANVSGGGGNSSNFSDFQVLTPQTVWYAVAPTSGTISNYNINISGYEI